MAEKAQNMNAVGSTPADNDDEDEDGVKKRGNIGVASFFIAKRASVKLIKFWRKY